MNDKNYTSSERERGREREGERVRGKKIGRERVRAIESEYGRGNEKTR